MSRDAQRYRKTYSYYRVSPQTSTLEIIVDESLDWKRSVRLASTGDISLAGSIPLTIDGKTVEDEDRVLLKDQSTGSENGIYYFELDAGAGTYTFTRASDARAGTLGTGAVAYVEDGTSNGGTAWVLSTIEPISVDSTSLTWSSFGGGGGGGGGGESWWFGAGPDAIYTTGSVGIGGTNGSAGSNAFFYVSGSVNGTGSEDKRSVFGGDVVMSGSLLASGDVVEITGSFLLSGSMSHGADTCTARGIESHAEGEGLAVGMWSHGEGASYAFDRNAHAEGREASALGAGSHAEGQSNLAVSDGSHAEGNHSVSGGSFPNQFSMTAGGTQLIIAGSDASSQYSVGNSLLVLPLDLTLGDIPFAVSYWAQCTNVYFDATDTVITISAPFDATTTAGFVSDKYLGRHSHAEGYYTIAKGDYSHAEGVDSQSPGTSSHAEGSDTRSTGQSSHAEGRLTEAEGDYSHAEGQFTVATGQASHASGTGTVAYAEGQNAMGAYNLSNNSDSLIVVGNGMGVGLRSDILRVNYEDVQITGSLIMKEISGIDGLINVVDIKGVKFNGSPASTDANVLDSYEEDNYTASELKWFCDSGDVTLDNINSKTTMVVAGRMLTINGYHVLSSVSTPGGRLSIQPGIPSWRYPEIKCAVSVYLDGWSAWSDKAGVQAYLDPVDETMYVDRFMNGSALQDLADYAQAGSKLYFSVTYMMAEWA